LGAYGALNYPLTQLGDERGAQDRLPPMLDLPPPTPALHPASLTPEPHRRAGTRAVRPTRRSASTTWVNSPSTPAPPRRPWPTTARRWPSIRPTPRPWPAPPAPRLPSPLLTRR